jgi:membrane protein implicated in regulation of membrane protease activity
MTDPSGKVSDNPTPNHEFLEEKLVRKRVYAPLFSWARFGPGAISILLLIAFLTSELYLSGHAYVAIISGAFVILLFGVKSMENIQLIHPETRNLLGQRCVVVKEVRKGKTGVVKVYGSDGKLDPELWSAESEHEIHKGQEAAVTALRNIVLAVKPIDCDPSFSRLHRAHGTMAKNGETCNHSTAG